MGFGCRAKVLRTAAGWIEVSQNICSKGEFGCLHSPKVKLQLYLYPSLQRKTETLTSNYAQKNPSQVSSCQYESMCAEIIQYMLGVPHCANVLTIVIFNDQYYSLSFAFRRVSRRLSSVSSTGTGDWRNTPGCYPEKVIKCSLNVIHTWLVPASFLHS